MNKINKAREANHLPSSQFHYYFLCLPSGAGKPFNAPPPELGRSNTIESTLGKTRLVKLLSELLLNDSISLIYEVCMKQAMASPEANNKKTETSRKIKYENSK